MSKLKIAIILATLLMPTVMAEYGEIVIFKDNYNKFETVQGEIKFYNISLTRDITLSNLKFKNAADEDIPIAKNLIKVNDSFYVFYFDIPDIPGGEYRTLLSDLQVNLEGVANNLTRDIIINNKSAVSIRPGYHYAKLKYYEEAKLSLIINNNVDEMQEIEITGDEIFNVNEKFKLLGRQRKVINLESRIFRKQGSYFISSLKVKYNEGSYNIPIIISREAGVNRANNSVSDANLSSESTNYSVDLKDSLILTDNFGSEVDKITLRVKTNLSYVANLSLLNTKKFRITNLEIILTDRLDNIMSVTPKILNYLEPEEKKNFNVEINKNKNLDRNYTGNLKVESDGAELLIIPVLIIFEDSKAVSLNEQATYNLTNKTKDKIEKQANNKTVFWIIVSSILLVFLLLIYIIYRKSRAKQKEFEEFIDNVKKRQ